ncbi:hypothetical protein P154DRAFT_517739 [Amniculicola lignicola CBS 123094]|uniref:Protein artemis n=1 Tax=Amniculicola lignicola CBS 123094 TaxID=1392246 RepID=A0A6A5X2V9_9PLEO|nr:hypothetical protein P154DRAFT_517739 [Amniculicola lignicola CBS 123094]
MNFAKGLLESRNVTYKKHLHKLAKPLPLETPTMIELGPEMKLRVTLFDANHCIGAVMFLIEGDGKAILYTGDIRAETWWVNSLVQNPVLLPYASGIRRLDCMYLDTTFATKSAPYREFPSKAEGIRELLQKVEEYPEDTIFYFHAWTFGYENAWIALATSIGTQIHLDSYRSRIYGSLSTLNRDQLRESGLNVQGENRYLRDHGIEIREAPALCGFRNGNHIQRGCLTSNPNTRIHSCERGMGCPVIDHDSKAQVVHIIPIVSRSNNIEIAELGAGGGHGDLDQKGELETSNRADVGRLMELCTSKIEDAELLSKVMALLQQALNEDNNKIELDMDLQKDSQDSEDGLSLQSLVSVLSTHATEPVPPDEKQNRIIRFPYSRHSSYSELCELVQAFKPKDVFPCTVDESTWTPSMGMQSLFGQFCSESIFRHDREMMKIYEYRQSREKRSPERIEMNTPEKGYTPSPITSKRRRIEMADEELDASFVTPAQSTNQISCIKSRKIVDIEVSANSSLQPLQETDTDIIEKGPCRPLLPPHGTSINSHPSESSVSNSEPSRKDRNLSKSRRSNRNLAYEAALGIEMTWADFGGLGCTKDEREKGEEVEL